MYSQKDIRWGKLKINKTNTTLQDMGCFITALSYLAGVTPDVGLKKLEEGKAFNKDLIISDKAAKALGLQYLGKFPPNYSHSFTTIAEVDFNPATQATEQHFVIIKPGGEILDPWTGGEPAKKYKIISIRAFKGNEPSAPSTLPKDLQEFADLKGISTYQKALESAIEYRNERNKAQEMWSMFENKFNEEEKANGVLTDRVAQLTTEKSGLEAKLREASLQVVLQDQTNTSLITDLQTANGKIDELERKVMSQQYEVVLNLGDYQIIKSK